LVAFSFSVQSFWIANCSHYRNIRLCTIKTV